MLHPHAHAQATPDKPAYIMAATGEAVSYAQLEARANQGARLLRSLGLKRGDGVALFMDNSPRYFELLWAAERIGIYCTCIQSKLVAEEVEYIVRDAAEPEWSPTELRRTIPRLTRRHGPSACLLRRLPEQLRCVRQLRVGPLRPQQPPDRLFEPLAEQIPQCDVDPG